MANQHTGFWLALLSLQDKEQRARLWNGYLGHRRRADAGRRAYRLTVDGREAAALDHTLASCESTALEPVVCAAPSGSSGAAGGVAGDDALARYDDNRNGAITCAKARRHGIAPVPRSHPAYPYMRDGGGDGVVCE